MLAASICCVPNFSTRWDGTKADLDQCFNLVYVLKKRLKLRMVRNKVSTKDYKWKWFERNMSRFAVMTYVVGHTTPGCTRKTNTTLLPHPVSDDHPFLIASTMDLTDTEDKFEGSYLFYNVKERKWVLSSMFVGGIGDALTCCEMSRELESVSGHNSTHWLTDVEYYYGICFNRNCANDSLIKESNGVLIWDSNTLNKLSETNIEGCATMYEKKLLMFGYFLELGYSLMLNDNSNLSKYSGFHSVPLV